MVEYFDLPVEYRIIDDIAVSLVKGLAKYLGETNESTN